MNSLAQLDDLMHAPHPEKSRFLRWQCRVRQMAMRGKSGQPDDGVMPAVLLPGEDAPMGQIVTVLSKRAQYSKTPELMHIARRTNDPAQRREKALQYFSETYFQKANEFSDVLTAVFSPNSAGARSIEDAGTCNLLFDAYGQHFDLACTVSRLAPDHWQHQATWWHNFQFNPHLHPQSVVLAFKPDWDRCTADEATQRNNGN
ncbi:hypothetical protein [Hoeflea sp. TYP-13]|uniref:hypothetical protein n=1 Tax=Hoeflea sp. TYP-13 TaxID=3230023 RepID=UPI0034C6C4B6